MPVRSELASRVGLDARELPALLAALERIRACTLQCDAMVSEAGRLALPRIWHWSPIGWQFGHIPCLLHPYYWRPAGGRRGSHGKGGGTWRLRLLFGEVDLPLDHPVCGMSWFEAEAYARFAGKRLLTEAEWERAAQLAAPEGGNYDCTHAGTVPAGSLAATVGETCPEAGSPGGLDLAGNVWEWTASWFQPYDGFQPGPYRRYSEPQFGEVYKVLKGGCWATIRALTRPSFRNWYNPYLRQIFAGVRLASDP